MDVPMANEFAFVVVNVTNVVVTVSACLQTAACDQTSVRTLSSAAAALTRGSASQLSQQQRRSNHVVVIHAVDHGYNHCLGMMADITTVNLPNGMSVASVPPDHATIRSAARCACASSARHQLFCICVHVVRSSMDPIIRPWMGPYPLLCHSTRFRQVVLIVEF